MPEIRFWKKIPVGSTVTLHASSPNNFSMVLTETTPAARLPTNRFRSHQRT